MSHPEEQLAQYVDGTLEQRVRAEVDAHLATCDTCREEIELARGARTVLADLTEVALPPRLVRPSLSGSRRSPRDRFGRTAWAAGLAAAASIAAILALIVSGPGGSGAGNVAERAPEHAAQAGGVTRTGADYDRAGIRQLAEQLATRFAEKHRVLNAAGGSNGGGSATATTTTGSSSSDTTAQPSSAPAPKSASTPAASGPVMGAATSGGTYDAIGSSPRACVTSGAGLPQETKPIRLIQARYKGQPVYIGAFLEDGALPDRLVLWVVSTRTCHALTSVEQLIP